MIIAIDLDKTICTPISRSYEKSEVMSCKLYNGAREFLIEAKKRGHYIKIFTHRMFSLRGETERWLKLNNIPYDELIMDKPKFHIFIDDRAINFSSSWKSLKNKLRKLEKKYGKD